MSKQRIEELLREGVLEQYTKNQLNDLLREFCGDEKAWTVSQLKHASKEDVIDSVRQEITELASAIERSKAVEKNHLDPQGNEWPQQRITRRNIQAITDMIKTHLITLGFDPEKWQFIKIGSQAAIQIDSGKVFLIWANPKVYFLREA